jgi:chemotaxis protein CheC
MSAEPVNDASATPRAIAFTADERGAAAELFNIGMGRAAASLSRMVGDEVELSIPHVEILTVETLLERLAQQGVDDVSLVVQRFEGMFTGEALLVFPYEQSLELVRVLLSEATALEHITELERDVLAEVGNVLINACLGSPRQRARRRVRGEHTGVRERRGAERPAQGPRDPGARAVRGGPLLGA